ncbi:unnamed protein product [Cercopithifilaria johnstoni]|uniref:Uncharacterized protein n=1 Tax=Cercopithifilaria johnstoni TaxID=2874296 RepID=A0A8J2M5G4_9BILA|nr:unnamed protein product [Cercopithifilaria johnstoni]
MVCTGQEPQTVSSGLVEIAKCDDHRDDKSQRVINKTTRNDGAVLPFFPIPLLYKQGTIALSDTAVLKACSILHQGQGRHAGTDKERGVVVSGVNETYRQRIVCRRRGGC